MNWISDEPPSQVVLYFQALQMLFHCVIATLVQHTNSTHIPAYICRHTLSCLLSFITRLGRLLVIGIKSRWDHWTVCVCHWLGDWEEMAGGRLTHTPLWSTRKWFPLDVIVQTQNYPHSHLQFWAARYGPPIIYTCRPMKSSTFSNSFPSY